MSNARKLADNLPSEGSLSGRNLVQNGAFSIAQRGTSSTSYNGVYGTVDRWKLQSDGMDQLALTQTQDTNAPSGFKNSYKVTVTTPETSVTDAEMLSVFHPIEAQNLQRLAYGTSDAKSITASFYVKSSVTGNYCLALYAPDGNRSIGAVYTINTANTWEYKTVTFPPDTSGVINNDNGAGLEFYFFLTMGPDRKTANNTSWATWSAARFAFGQVADIAATTNATWQITGVQLEVGPQSTPFEHEPVAVTLSKCQRYYQTYGGNDAYEHLPFYGLGNGTVANFNYGLPVEMRSAPSVSSVSGWVVQGPYGASTYTVGSFALGNTTTKVVRGDIQGISSSIGNNTVRLFALNSTNARFNLDAEL
jgi:hypothetical protein